MASEAWACTRASACEIFNALRLRLDDACNEKHGVLCHVARVALTIDVRPSTMFAVVVAGPAAYILMCFAAGSVLWLSVSLMFPAWQYRNVACKQRWRDGSLEEGGSLLLMTYVSAMLGASLFLWMCPSLPFIAFCRAAIVVWLFAPQTQGERLERCALIATTISAVLGRMRSVTRSQQWLSQAVAVCSLVCEQAWATTQLLTVHASIRDRLFERFEGGSCIATICSSLLQKMPDTTWLQPYFREAASAWLTVRERVGLLSSLLIATWSRFHGRFRARFSERVASQSQDGVGVSGGEDAGTTRRGSLGCMPQPIVALNATTLKGGRPGGSRKRVGTPPPTSRGVSCAWMCRECVAPRNFIDLPLPVQASPSRLA